MILNSLDWKNKLNKPTIMLKDKMIGVTFDRLFNHRQKIIKLYEGSLKELKASSFPNIAPTAKVNKLIQLAKAPIGDVSGLDTYSYVELPIFKDRYPKGKGDNDILLQPNPKDLSVSLNPQFRTYYGHLWTQEKTNYKNAVRSITASLNGNNLDHSPINFIIKYM